jgi:inhibitor of cysteine peptidase
MSEITVTQNDRGKIVEVSQGDVISVRLEEIPTTGYRWALVEVDNRILDLRSSDYVITPNVGIGGGGTRTFAFVAQSPGTTRVRFQLRQEWAPENPEKDFEMTVNVRRL